jgi:hypothetical protein
MINTPFTKAITNVMSQKPEKLLYLQKCLARAEAQCIIAWAGHEVPIFSDYAHCLLRNTEDISHVQLETYKNEVRGRYHWMETTTITTKQPHIIEKHFNEVYGITFSQIRLIREWLKTATLFSKLQFPHPPVRVQELDNNDFEALTQRFEGYLQLDKNRNTAIPYRFTKY